MSSPILGRVVMLIVLLAVPLSLAVASQALASRPGSPDVEDRPVRLPGASISSGSPGPTPTPEATPSGPGSSSPTPEGPRTVRPEVPAAEDDDADDDADDDGDDGEDADD